MKYIVNGMITLSGVSFWSIDDLKSGRSGLDMIKNPVALVPELDMAHKICDALNQAEKKNVS